jgi:uncharacterized membrane protein
MHRTSNARGQQTATFASLRWWASALAICVICLIGALVELIVLGRVAMAVSLFCLVVVTGSFATRARQEYRRGWRHGYETATRVLIERSAGRVTDVEARAAVNGDPTPEPWDRHVPVMIVRSPR